MEPEEGGDTAAGAGIDLGVLRRGQPLCSYHLYRSSLLLEGRGWLSGILSPATLVLIPIHQRKVVSCTLVSFIQPVSKGDAAQIGEDIPVVQLLAALLLTQPAH